MKKTQSGHSQGGERRFSSPWPVGQWFPFDTSQDRGNGFLGKRTLGSGVRAGPVGSSVGRALAFPLISQQGPWLAGAGPGVELMLGAAVLDRHQAKRPISGFRAATSALITIEPSPATIQRFFS